MNWDLENIDLTEVNRTKTLLEELKTLPAPSEEKKRELEKKYRLNWNFHSNKIEGNKLTYGETEMLLIRGKSTGDHDKRDYDEMEAHDHAIELIKEWAQDLERDITEQDIKDLNRALLIRPFWKEAITADGQHTRKKIIPGQYKETPNSVRLKNGEIHHYASPEETPAKMGDLMKFNQKTKNIDPILRAAMIHHEFTSIHPFDDGNGRVARLWANYILLKASYTPLVIRTETKEDYLTALAQADTGNFQPFVDYIAKELRWSIELAEKAAKGESLEEPGDLDKKIALLEKKIESSDHENVKVQYSKSSMLNQVKSTFLEVVRRTLVKSEKVQKWFNYRELEILINGSGKNLGDYDELSEYLLDKNNFKERTNKITFTLMLRGFKKAGPDAFDQYLTIEVNFREWVFEFIADRQQRNVMGKYLYDHTFSEEELNLLIEQYVNILVENIDATLNRLKK